MTHAEFLLTTKSKQKKFTHMIALNSTEFVREFKANFEVEPLTFIPVFSGIILVYYTDNEISETKQAEILKFHDIVHSINVVIFNK